MTQKEFEDLTDRINILNDRLARQEAELAGALEENRRLREANERLNTERIDLARYLIDHADTLTPADLCQKATDIIGHKAYLSYKIEKGKELTRTDKAMLLDALR